MEKIASFKIDHTKLLPGLYVSREDISPSGCGVTTFDVRLTAPNREPAVNPEALHTLEHLIATFLRNDVSWGSKIVYWGPMGCCTGMYLIVWGLPSVKTISKIVTEAFEFAAGFSGEIPGATPHDCGNYTFNDLETAKSVARKYLDEVLYVLDESNTKYPE